MWANFHFPYVFLAFIVALLLLSTCAKAQQGLPDGLVGEQIPLSVICSTPEVLNLRLLETHGEMPKAFAISKDKQVMMTFYADQLNSSMSFVVTNNNKACVFLGLKCDIGQCFLTKD